MSFTPDSSGTTEHELTVKELLQLILMELRILNTYNSLAHDEVIKEGDINAN